MSSSNVSREQSVVEVEANRRTSGDATPTMNANTSSTRPTPAGTPAIAMETDGAAAEASTKPQDGSPPKASSPNPPNSAVAETTEEETDYLQGARHDDGEEQDAPPAVKPAFVAAAEGDTTTDQLSPAAHQGPPASRLEGLERVVEAANDAIPFATLNVPVSGVAAAHRETVAQSAMLTSAAGGATAVNIGYSLPLLSVELLRDYWQIVGCVLAFAVSAPATESVMRDSFVRITAVFNLDFAFVLPTSLDRPLIHMVVWYILFVFGVIFVLLLARVAHKTALPAGRTELLLMGSHPSSAGRMVGALGFLVTLLYLPVTQMGLERVLCNHRIVNVDGECPPWYEVASAGVGLAVVSLAAPVVMVVLIASNAPKKQRYDSSGEPVVRGRQSELDYIRELAVLTKRNPVASLFNKYRQSMRYYKVLVMVLKLLVAVAAVGFSANDATTGFVVSTTPGDVAEGTTRQRVFAEPDGDFWNHIRAICLLGLVFLFWLLCLLRRPFIAGVASGFDSVLRFLSVLAMSCVYILIFDNAVATFTIVLLVILSFALLLSLVLVISSLGPVQESFRKMLGDVNLTATSRGDPRLLWFNTPAIEWHKERRVRVWQDFWDRLLLFTPPFKYKAPEGSDAPLDTTRLIEFVDADDSTTPHLLDFKGSVAERHKENIAIAGNIGRSGFIDHYGAAQTEEETKALAFALRVLNGPDCFMPFELDKVKVSPVEEGGEPYEEEADTPGQFGLLTLLPMPFEGVFRPDNAEEPPVPIAITDLSKLVAANKTTLVQQVRRRRLLLRGLAYMCQHSDVEVEFKHQEERSITLHQGGHTLHRTVMCYFSKGKLKMNQPKRPTFSMPSVEGGEGDDVVAGTAKHEMTLPITAGFDPLLEFQDGEYVEYGGGTLPGPVVRGRTIGVTPELLMNPELERLLTGGENATHAESGRQEVTLIHDGYRRYAMSQALAKSHTLSFAFWARVYCDDSLPRGALEERLGAEKNEQLRMLAANRANVLDVVYARLEYFDSCPAVALWVCFWHDLWTRNLDLSDMAKRTDVSEVLNPSSSTALIWNVASQDAISKELRRIGLQSDSGAGFINKLTLTRLYSAMARVQQEERVRMLQDAQVVSPPTAAGGGSAPPPHLSFKPGQWTQRRASASGISAPDSTFVRVDDRTETLLVPLFGRCLVPFVQHRVSATENRDLWGGPDHPVEEALFYPDDDGSIHYQRYAILQRLYGGVLSATAYQSKDWGQAAAEE